MGDKSVPVDALKVLCDEQNLKIAVLLGWDGDLNHVVTYGETVSQSDHAATYGNTLKKQLGWSDDLQMPSPKVTALVEENEGLKAKIIELESKLSK